MIDKPDLIIKILLSIGFDENTIKEVPNQHLIMTPRPGGDNPAGLLIYTNSLQVVGNTRAEYTGNLFTLVMKIKSLNFPESLKYISKCLNLDIEDVEIVRPFGGFYKNVCKLEDDGIIYLPSYDENKLPPNDKLSKKFLNDNISLQIQEKWGVRYSVEDDAILIPIYFNNNLVGCKARANGNVDMSKRWWAYMPYHKTQVVYGFDNNYKDIIDKNKCIITESEKGVLQLASMDINLGLAIAGHSISNAQAKYIKSLKTSEIILAFDQDLDEEEIRYEAKKLIIKNNFINNKVSYIYDDKGIYLPIGSKMSPTDKNKEIFMKLYNERKIIT